MTEGTTLAAQLQKQDSSPAPLQPIHFPTSLPSASPLPRCLPPIFLTIAPPVFTPGLRLHLRLLITMSSRNPVYQEEKIITFTVFAGF